MISVLTPFFNSEEYLPILCEGLKTQLIPAGLDWEFIAVDDGSTDNGMSVLMKYESVLPIRLERLKSNRGRSFARNKCLELAKGDLLCFIDADMQPCPDWLVQYQSAFKDKKLNVAIGATELAHELRNDRFRIYWNTRGIAKGRVGQIPFHYFYTCNCCFRRSVLENVGLFDENFRVYGGEDDEYGYRLVQAGFEIHYVEVAKTIHHNRNTMSQILAQLESYGRFGLPYFIAKFPAASRMFRMDLVCSNSPVRRIISALLLSRAILFFSNFLSCAPWPRFFLYRIYDLIVFQHCGAGLRESLKETKTRFC